jgi:hypothetical protein
MLDARYWMLDTRYSWILDASIAMETENFL